MGKQFKVKKYTIDSLIIASHLKQRNKTVLQKSLLSQFLEEPGKDMPSKQ